MSRDELAIGAAIPGFALRILGVAVVAGAALALQPAPFLQIASIVLAVAGAVFPRTGLSWVALLVVPLALLVGDASPARTAIAIAAVHLGHVLATLCLAIPGRSRAALAALAPTARRWIGVQLVSQVVAAAILLVPRADGSGLAWAAPIGAIAVAGLAYLLLRRTN
ncbi:hypothetical protein GCM10010922_05090 [Microbacterium sorbitolivorans]|uniref:Uncharacterized protein n=1 Tax=Microbacterium sorbitolivorans TaxID=1867410 RepID=A0A367Y8M2_9MICO|nr:hypothetical protein [Microbacterium sorbitolivorans]RCK61351.1 hypothetical protein DTO57_01485 [Microbacterium sorbitolivorans]GGF33008.1 hypothetical protein GCM10010922_05090 [Microbacterium sorbitolivorans]